MCFETRSNTLVRRMAWKTSQVLCLNQDSKKLSSTWKGEETIMKYYCTFDWNFYEKWNVEQFQKMMFQESILVRTQWTQISTKKKSQISFFSFVCPSWVSWLLLINWFYLTFCDAVKINTNWKIIYRDFLSLSGIFVSIYFVFVTFCQKSKTN